MQIDLDSGGFAHRDCGKQPLCKCGDWLVNNNAQGVVGYAISREAFEPMCENVA